MGKLSGGQQAQLALTLALARRPRLLVFDEPLANLDLALYLLIMGLKIHSAYASVASCHPARSPGCEAAANLFSGSYHGTAQAVTGLLQVVPALIGVFVGAPLLARELETGTFRFAWTQGCGRPRWVVAKLALPAVAVTAASFAFSVLFSWCYQPLFACTRTAY